MYEHRFDQTFVGSRRLLVMFDWRSLLLDIIEEQSVDRWQSRTQKQRSDEDQTSKIKMFVVDKVLAKYVVQQAFVE